MAKKFRKKKDGEDEKKESGKNGKTDLAFGNIIDHVKEPLLWVCLLSFLTSAASFFAGSIQGYLSFMDAKTVSLSLAAILGILFLASVGIIYFLYSMNGRSIRNLIGAPILILLTFLFLWWGYQELGRGAEESAGYFSIFALFFGLLTFTYILWVHKIMKLATAGIIAIFFTTLVMHMTPAYTPPNSIYGRYISDLDSYFYYRHANATVETGFVPEHETLAYPVLPPVVDSQGHVKSWADFSQAQYGSSVLMASMTTVLSRFGFSVYDIAILYPGVFSAFTVLVFYLLLRDLFWDMRPYNYAAALLGAFMLMTNPSYASRAIATDCEDDTFGMFLSVAALLLFVISIRRKSLMTAVLSGFALLALYVSWGGYSYAVVVMGIFSILYAISSFINKKSTVEHIPYLAVSILISFLNGLILHGQGQPPALMMPSITYLTFFGGAVVISFVLEVVRKRYLSGGKARERGDSIEDKIEGLMEKYATYITLLLLLMAAFYLLFVSDVKSVVEYVVFLATSAKQTEILGMTTAEQRPLCEDPNNFGKCLESAKGHFGLGVVFGLCMIPVLLYFMLFKRSMGAAFVLTWSLPLLYGVVYKSQYQFAASVPIVALGSTIGLIVALKKDDIQSLRIVPTFILTVLPILLYVLGGGIFLFGPFGGPSPMEMKKTVGERALWEGTFQWLKQQPNNIIVLTWWDYGHWITAETQRISILDNTKHQRFMVQDIAKFHVVEENETEALEIARKYRASYVIIDWPMIGKSGAPHFIATSGLGEYIPLNRIGAQAECENGRDCDKIFIEGDGYASVPIGSSIVIDFTNEYVISNARVLLAPLDSDGYYGYKIEASTDKVTWQTIVDKTTGEFRGLQADPVSDVRAHYIRITGTFASSGNDLRVESAGFYNPRYEGDYIGYAQCGFSPDASTIKPTYEINKATGAGDMVSKIVFGCNNGVGLLFDIRNGQYSVDNVYVLYGGRTYSWKSWRDNTGSSILGIQSLTDILGNALNYPDRYASFPTFDTLVYVPGKGEIKDGKYDMNQVMMTKLYLGDHLEEYQAAGLADAKIEKPKYFTLVPGFEGNKQDSSYWGYVRAYKINYPEDDEIAASPAVP